MSEPNGKPLELGSGPSLTTVTSDAGTTAVGTVRGKTYPITVTQVPPNAAALTLSVDYPAGRDYKAGAPQTVTTTAAAHTRNIALSYGHTTTLDGRVTHTLPSGIIVARNDATVIVSVEGREVDRTLSRTIEGRVGDYSITFEHPGAFRAAASFSGRNEVHSRSNYRRVLTDRHNFILRP